MLSTPRRSRFSSLLLASCVSAAIAGCGGATPAATDATTPASSDSELRFDGHSYRYIYTGPLPKLDKPAIFVSLASSTVRVTGLLPVGYAEPLPFYAQAVPMGTRTGIVVVYPVATGAHTNGPGNYSNIVGHAYVPTTTKAAWGGFPFLEYNHQRGLAFHGPITEADSLWHLIRGPVSHGCNRMQGEHVVELAQMLGFNMRIPHSSSEQYSVTVPVTVSTALDSYQGKYVDVDYPALASVKHPAAAQSTVFPTWDSRDFPTLVCPYNPKRALGVDHCADQGTDRYDLLTGL